MEPRTAPLAAPGSATAAVISSASDAPTLLAGSTLGARLAAVSRRAQGFASAVSDPAVLAELRELCAAPLPTKRALLVERERPAS